MADVDVFTLSRQIASITKELALVSNLSDEYARERTKLYANASEHPNDFAPMIESNLAGWILKRRLESTGQTKVLLGRIESSIERAEAEKVPELEEQIRRLSEDISSMQGDLSTERRATSEYALRNLKSLNDFYFAYQMFKPGEHAAFKERLSMLLGSDSIASNLEEMFTNIRPGEDFELQKEIIDPMCLSVYKIVPFLEEENERASQFVAKLSQKAANQKATIAGLQKQIQESASTLRPIMDKQRERLAKFKEAMTPLIKNYEGQYSSPDEDARLLECIDFVVGDLAQKAAEINGFEEQRKALEQKYSDLEQTFRKETEEYEAKLSDAYATAERARQEMDNAVSERDAARKQLELYQNNFGNRVDEEASKRTSDLEDKVSVLQKRVDVTEHVLAKAAHDFGDAGQYSVADDIYTRIIALTEDAELKSQYLANRGAIRLKASRLDEGRTDLEESYSLNPVDKVKEIMDLLPPKGD